MVKSLEKSSEEIKTKKSKIKRIIIVFFAIMLSLLLIGFYGLRKYYEGQIQPIAITNIQDIELEIPQGSSTIKIASILKEKELIRNELIFRYTAKTLGMDGSLKAGKHILNNGMSIEEILKKLQNGGILKATVRFTIPEGYELKEIAEKLSSEGFVEQEKFLELAEDPKRFVDKFPILAEIPEGLNLEGYLYPDTYEIFVDSTEVEIIEKMLGRFNEVYTKEIFEKAKGLNMSLNEVIALASIIEREGMLDKERPLISAVFHNRLVDGTPLQSCATVQFILEERKPNLSIADTKIESVYNTYINKGLPPGPIASPGIKSIEAAVNPADVDYKYFVANGDGSHTFSTTYRDHINAKNKIRNK